MDSSKSAHFWRSVARGFTQVLLWPFRTAWRLTKDGILFAFLALSCSVLAARSDESANIPLLICLVLFSVLASALMISSAALRGLSFSRRCAERVFAGEPLPITLTITNKGRLPVTGLVLSESLRTQLPGRGGAFESQASQRLVPVGSAPSNPALKSLRSSWLWDNTAPAPGNLASVSGQSFAVAVAGRSNERTLYTLRVRRRGLYTFGRTRLETVYPFGFWRSKLDRRVEGRLVVYPRLGEIDSSFFLEVDTAFQRMQRARPSREEQDFRGLREYRHGDNPRWIHWKSSARQNRWLVKEYEEPQSRRVILYLDTNLQRVGGQRNVAFERAISFAATVSRELIRRGCDVTTVAQHPGRPAYPLAVQKDRRNLDQLFEMLAGLGSDNTRTLEAARNAVPPEDLRNAFILVLGLGSLRMKAPLGWLSHQQNMVKTLDVRSEEFRRVFKVTGAGAPREDMEEDLPPLDELRELDEALAEG